MASSTDFNLKALSEPVGIKLGYSSSSVVELKVKVTGKSASYMDMKVVEERGTQEKLIFQAKGKFFSKLKGAIVEDADGKELYVLRQKRAKLPYGFWAVDRENYRTEVGNLVKGEEKDEESEDKAVFRATARGGLKRDLLDVECFVFPGSDGQKSFTLKTGPLRTVSEIVDQDGNIVAYINRTTSNMKKIWNPAENYLLKIAPGVDSSLVFLIFLCLHIQLVNYKMGYFF